MSGTEAPPSDALSPARPLFVGRRGGRMVTFVCSDDGSFGIWCGGGCLSVWAADELEIALRAYLGFVEGPDSWAVTTPLNDEPAPRKEASAA